MEIANLLKTMRRSNVMSIRKTLSILNDYVKWCIANGKRKTQYENNINYMDIFIKTESDLNKYVSNRQLYNKILNKEEFEDLLSIPINPSDQAILLCLYEFIGREELYELRTIEAKNIDKETNTIKLINKDGNIRISKISNRLIELLEDTNETEKYLSNNGELNSRNILTERPLTESNYVFRQVRKGKSVSDIMPYQSVLNRIKINISFIELNTAYTNKQFNKLHTLLEVMFLEPIQAGQFEFILKKIDIMEDGIERLYERHTKDKGLRVLSVALIL